MINWSPNTLAGFPVRTIEGNLGKLTKNWIRFADWTNNIRSRWCEIPYGDQGLFCTRKFFEMIGGFSAVPLMEDCGLVARAHAFGPVRVAPDLSPMSTYIGSFLILGPFFTMQNYMILSLWYLNIVGEKTLFRWYYPTRTMTSLLSYKEICDQYTASELGRVMK